VDNLAQDLDYEVGADESAQRGRAPHALVVAAARAA
jgi:hypothetical protein